MAFENYVANFSAVLPRMRSVAAISADVELWRSGRATDITRSQIAAIELQIRVADDLYQRRQYDPALQQFRQARASIYALLYPAFNISAYAIAKDRLLPVSKVMETSLIDLSLRITDSMRPLTIESIPLTRMVATESVPQPLVQFMQTGFRESQNADELLQAAAAHGVALVNDGKPEAAIELMSQALDAKNSSGTPDRAMLAAVNLNIASAFVQAGTPERAIEPARTAQKLFRSTQDGIGFAQALHGEAIATQRAGDAAGAEKLFSQAAESLTAAMTGGAPIQNQPNAANAIAIRSGPPPILSSRQTAATVVFEQTAVLATRDLQTLQPIMQKDASTLMLRVPGRADGWSSVPVANDTQRKQLAKSWQVGESLLKTRFEQQDKELQPVNDPGGLIDPHHALPNFDKSNSLIQP